MKTLSLTAVLFFSIVATATVAGWRPVDGMSEAEAERLTAQAISEYLAVDEDGEVCGVDEIWGLEREKDTVPDRPGRGEIFSIVGYARGPDLGCSITRNFDCRVVFHKPPKESQWKVEFVDCEPTSPRYDD